MGYKTVDGLMRHLRDNGIQISGSIEKRQLINTGYFHGYKGYRFFKDASHQIPFNTFSDVNATITYDSDLKAMFYKHLMFIETAVKNVALNRIMKDANSELIPDMLSKVVIGYHSFPTNANVNERKKAQKAKLTLENHIQTAILKAYTHENPKITHFYDTAGYNSVPLWALFEILTLGDFATLLSCLHITTRKHIADDLGMRVASVDTNYELIYRYIYVMKDLRNAVAHNAVIFDARFNQSKPSKAMQACLKQRFHLPYLNFDTIGDYIILVCYYLDLLKVSKTKIKGFIREYEKTTESYINSVNPAVSSIVIHPDWRIRIENVKNYL